MKKQLAVLIAVLLYNAAFGHPHVFITPDVEVYVNADGFKSMRISWAFDDMTGAGIIEALDKNRDNALSPDETKKIREEIFPGLSAYNYYTVVIFDGKTREKIKAGKFEIRIDEKGRLIYVFKAGFEKNGRRSMLIYFEDETIYTGFDFGAQCVKVLDAVTEKPVDARLTEKEMDYSFGVEIGL